MFKIVDNLERTNNHYNKLRTMIKDATDLLIVSPFLMPDFTPFLSELDFKGIKSFRLVTTLKGNNLEQISKLDSFISIIDFFAHYPTVKYSINIDNKLHGKIYIFKSQDNYTDGIITSANFTERGLNQNHEWGVEIQDETILSNLEKSIFSEIQYSDLSIDTVLEMLLELDNYYKNHPNQDGEDIDLDLKKYLPEKSKTETDIDIDIDIDGEQFWLKPIGVTDDPVKEGEDFSALTYRLDFSRRRPSGVKVGDIVISYCVGITKILSVYQVTSDPIYATATEIKNEARRDRWPWSIGGHNLTPEYGSKWWKYDLTLSELINQYLDANPGSYITAVGGRTLGALQFGSDKVKLNSDFAKFIIKRVPH